MNIKIPKEIIEFGVDIDTIKYLHSKTRLSKMDIVSISLAKKISPDRILLKISLSMEYTTPYGSSAVNRRMSVLEISKQKLRSQRLNILFS